MQHSVNVFFSKHSVVTMADYRNAPFSKTLNDPKNQNSRSGHSLTLNISEMAKDTAIVTVESEYLSFQMIAFSVTYILRSWCNI